MANYSFTTRWRVHAPPEQIWNALIDAENYPSWWKSILRVQPIAPGDANGIGRTERTTWKTFLLYGFTFETRVTRIEWQRTLALDAFGELEGTGLWTLTPASATTIVRYDWNVKTTKAWMNFIVSLARPFFNWNHAAVMNDGAKGLAQLLNAKVEPIKD